MQDCRVCDGAGYYRDGTTHRCDTCLGTGRELTREQRELLEAVERMLEMRYRYGAR